MELTGTFKLKINFTVLPRSIVVFSELIKMIKFYAWYANMNVTPKPQYIQTKPVLLIITLNMFCCFVVNYQLKNV